MLQNTQQNLLSDPLFKSDNTLLAPVSNQLANSSFFDFNQHLAEPILLHLEDKNDKYVLNVQKKIDPNLELKVDVKDGILTISGAGEQSKSDSGDGVRSVSYSSSSFQRSTRLPQDVDQRRITANYGMDGNVRILMPKLNAQSSQNV